MAGESCDMIPSTKPRPLTLGGPDLTVSVFVWGCGDSAHKDYIVGVFDLNQYYHSQVPKMLQWRSLRKRSG